MRALVLTALVAAGLAGAQEWAKARLEKSPRHLEYITIEHGGRKLTAFIAYPEVKEKATAVVVIHEIFGLSDWVRGVTDQLAEAGYIAIAPDLLSGMAPGGGGTAEFKSADAVRTSIRNLKPDVVTADLNATCDYVAKLPACNGKVAVSGFCWGGGQAFRFASARKDLKASFVFYGSGLTDPDLIAKIECPVHGFYGENDARINAGIPEVEGLMKKGSKSYQPVIYKGAGHGFLRAGEGPDAKPDDVTARGDAWIRWKEILAKL